MPQESLDFVELIFSRFQQMRGKGMSESMTERVFGVNKNLLLYQKSENKSVPPRR
jgi:hypothetical protein